MSRQTWKYYHTNQNELLNFLKNKFFFEQKNFQNNEKKNLTLNPFNYFFQYHIHTGKHFVVKNFNKKSLKYKLGQFVKTKRPCFFRTKKKK